MSNVVALADRRPKVAAAPADPVEAVEAVLHRFFDPGKEPMSAEEASHWAATIVFGLMSFGYEVRRHERT